MLLELDDENGIEWWKVQMIDPMYDPVHILEPVIRNQIIFYAFVDKVYNLF